MNFKKKKLTAGDVSFNIINYAVFGIFTLICIYPFYYMVINTLSANDLSAAGAINFLPKGIHFENYKALLELKGLGTAALVSVGKTVIGTALTVIATAFLGFMFTQEKMWKRKFWYRFIVITMYFNAGLIPMFITMKNLHRRRRRSTEQESLRSSIRSSFLHAPRSWQLWQSLPL